MLGLGIQLPWRQQALGIPRAGLVAYHDLYDPTASLASVPDLSGNGYALRLGSTAGADTNDPAWAAGGKGLVFTTDDYCLTADLPAMDLASPFTWVLIAKGITGDGNYIGGLCLPTGYSNYVLLQHFGPNTWRLRWDDGTGGVYNQLTVADDALHCVSVVRAPSSLKWQVWDTGAVGTVGTLRSPAGTPRLGLACMPGSSALYPWAKGEALTSLVWNRALSDAELQRIYRTLKATWAARSVTIS